MSNELLWILMLALNFACIMGMYVAFGKTGLYAWIAIAAILANVQVLKTVELFGFPATLGNILYAGSFLATDILSELHGKKDARRAIYIGFAAIIATTVFMQFALAFQASPDDFAHEHLSALFTILPRVTLGSIVAYVISQFHDIWAFGVWKRLLPGKQWLWLRNNASTWVSQLIDSLVFTSIAFLGAFPMEVFWGILLTTFAFKVIVAALDTPLLYLASYLHNRPSFRWRDKEVVE